MSTRREFLKHTASAGVVAAMSVQAARAVENIDLGAVPAPKATRDARRSEGGIKSAVRRDETTLRLGGMGDNFHMSWAADDRQLVAVCDGLGWFDRPKVFYNSRLQAIAGDPQGATFQDVADYPELIGVLQTEQFSRYYGFGTLALDESIYQFLSTPNHQFFHADSTPWRGARFVGAKLIYSPDNGRTWRNQDGTTPVLWEPREVRSRANMVFFEESQDAFSLLSVLQMGRGYAANRDGYVYVYSPNGNTEGTMNQLVMFRVPKDRILDRDRYEYFTGLGRDGTADWARDINARAVVHTFPGGWVNTQIHPWAWMPSVTYNSPLGLYMMASWGHGCTPDNSWFGKPSYLGLWTSMSPWGPWTQIHEEVAWTPQGDPESRAFAPQISPKWIAADGKSFWLVWADYQQKATHEVLERLDSEAKRATSSEDTVRFFQNVAKTKPYYSFNTQRVDLVFG